MNCIASGAGLVRMLLEQNNGRQRHWFCRFRRKTIAVSRSREMVDLTLFLFAAYHVNGSLELPSLFT